MGNIFNVDNRFFQGLNKLLDCFFLSLFWVLFSTPVITAGAATTALYYTVNKVIRNNRGYIWQEFWSAFKSNFKQSTQAWLLVLGFYLVAGIDLYIMLMYARAGAEIGRLYVVFLVLLVFITMWANYVFPYIARFSNSTKQVLKNTVLIAIANLQWTVLLTVLVVITGVVVRIFPPAVFILPAVYMMFANLILERVFKKYMSAEDLAAEEERNREFFN